MPAEPRSCSPDCMCWIRDEPGYGFCLQGARGIRTKEGQACRIVPGTTLEAVIGEKLARVLEDFPAPVPDDRFDALRNACTYIAFGIRVRTENGTYMLDPEGFELECTNVYRDFSDDDDQHRVSVSFGPKGGSVLRMAREAVVAIPEARGR